MKRKSECISLHMKNLNCMQIFDLRMHLYEYEIEILLYWLYDVWLSPSMNKIVMFSLNVCICLLGLFLNILMWSYITCMFMDKNYYVGVIMSSFATCIPFLTVSSEEMPDDLLYFLMKLIQIIIDIYFFWMIILITEIKREYQFSSSQLWYYLIRRFAC